MQDVQQFTIEDEEWAKILAFCSSGQTVAKRTDWGRDHKRKLQICEGKLSWQTGSISLENIRFIAVGDITGKPATIFFRKDSVSAKTVTIGSTERELHLTFPDIKSRNFWIKAITLHLALLPGSRRRFPDTYEQLQTVLNSTGEHPDRVTFSVDGAVRAQFLSKFSLGVDVPSIDDDATSVTSTFETNYNVGAVTAHRSPRPAAAHSIADDDSHAYTAAAESPVQESASVALPESVADSPQPDADTPVQNKAPEPQQIVVQEVEPPLVEETPELVEHVPSSPTAELPQSAEPNPSVAVSAKVARKLAQAHGVDPVSKMTHMLMRAGEVFRTYVDGQQGIMQKVHVNGGATGLIGEDISIPFSRIVAIRCGSLKDVPSANPLHAFEIEYHVFDSVRRRVVFEVVDLRSPSARRNFWINGILSHVAESSCQRLPQSVAQLNKLIGAITPNTTEALVLVPMQEALQNTESVSFDTSTASRSADTAVARKSIKGRLMPKASEETELARRRAARRVSKFRKFQKLARGSRATQQTEPEPAAAVDEDKPPAPVLDRPATQSPALTITIPEEAEAHSLLADAMPSHEATKEELPAVSTSAMTGEQAPEAGSTPLDSCAPTPRHESPTCTSTASGDENLRIVVDKLTSALMKMERQQAQQAEVMKKLMHREAVAAKAAAQKQAALNKQIKKLRHEKTLEVARNDGFLKQLKELQNEQKMRKWKAQKALEARCDKLTAERDQAVSKLEKSENKLLKAGNAFRMTQSRLQKELAQNQKQRAREETSKAEQIHELQGMRTRAQSLTEKNKRLKNEGRSLKHQLARHAQRAESWEEQFRAETRTSEGLRETITELQRETAMVGSMRAKLKMAEEWMSVHEGTHAELQDSKDKASRQSLHMQTLRRENVELMDANRALQEQLTELEHSSAKYVAAMQEQLDDGVAKREHMEKLYQRKLRDLTEFAQQQMLEQQQLLMGTKH